MAPQSRDKYRNLAEGSSLAETSSLAEVFLPGWTSRQVVLLSFDARHTVKRQDLIICMLE